MSVIARLNYCITNKKLSDQKQTETHVLKLAKVKITNFQTTLNVFPYDKNCLSGFSILQSCMFNGVASLYWDFELFSYEACSPRVDPLSSWLGRRKSVVYVSFLIEKVAYDQLVCGVKV